MGGLDAGVQNSSKGISNPSDINMQGIQAVNYQNQGNGNFVYNYPVQNAVIPPYNEDQPPNQGNMQGLNQQPVMNDLYNQIMQDVNQHPAKKRPGAFAACFDFSRISNIFRMINLGGFLTSLCFVVSDFDQYPYCLAPLIISWIIYWSDIFCCNSIYKSLKNIQIIHNLHEHIEQVKLNGTPTISFRMECYHYETRHRTVTHTDSNGHTHTRHETYQEKVVTWSGSDNFKYSRWTDESEGILGLEEFIYTRVHFNKKYILNDQRTVEEHARQKQQFVDANKWRDTHHSDWENFDISGYIEFALSSLKPKLPWFMNVTCYLIICIFMMEIFYNCYISCKTGKKQMTYVKRISC